MNGYYTRQFTLLGWGENEVFDVPAEIMSNKYANTVTICFEDRSLLVYRCDLAPCEFKPLKEYM